MIKARLVLNEATIDGFTEKEIDDRIKKEERRIDRIKSKMQDMRYDLHATHNALDMWKDEKKKLKKLQKLQKRKASK